MEKLIYVHLARLGESGEGLISDSTNDWYLIKQNEGGGGVELTRVFEDVSPPNHHQAGPALLEANCQVIGSCIYVIGGLSIKTVWPNCCREGSNMIHFIDTRNPKDGWRTCCSLPFAHSDGQSTVVDDQWLYILHGDRHSDCSFHDPWGYAVNLNNSKEVRRITPPSDSTGFPIFSTCLSPGTIVAWIFEDSNLYQLDCKNSTWSVYGEGSPCRPTWYFGCTTVVDDGILYILDSFDMQLRSYDIRNKNELYVVDLPHSFWFGDSLVRLIVLSRNRFCILWDFRAGAKKIYICYARFSVSHHPSKPTVDLEEVQKFRVAGYSLVNAVAVDPHSDEANSSSSNSNAVRP